MGVSKKCLSWLQSYCMCGDVMTSIGGGREGVECCWMILWCRVHIEKITGDIGGHCNG